MSWEVLLEVDEEGSADSSLFWVKSQASSRPSVFSRPEAESFHDKKTLWKFKQMMHLHKKLSKISGLVFLWECLS